VLLELASVTGEAMLHDPHARSGIEAAQGVEEESNASRDTEKAESPGTRYWKDENAGKVDSVVSTPSYIPDPNSTRSSTARPTRAKGPQAQMSDTPKPRKARVIESNSSDGTAVSMTITACTRCRAVI
jgi:hypothetical protein